jgi:hypothetical protein
LSPANEIAADEEDDVEEEDEEPDDEGDDDDWDEGAENVWMFTSSILRMLPSSSSP